MTNPNDTFESCPGLATAYDPYEYAHGYLRSAMQGLETARTLYANDPELFYAAVDVLLKQACALEAAMKEVLAQRA